MAFTKAQNKAIDTRNKTILVSAAAGSGKTTTLTERIIRLLTDNENPADIGRFLIVTFTNASAADLRSKITAAVSKALAADPSNRHLNRQLLKLGSAHICTMDSFYLDVVRENFQALGIGASSRIIDPNQREIIMNEIMSSVISEKYEESADFALAMDCLSLFTQSFRATPSSLNISRPTVKRSSVSARRRFLRAEAEGR